MENEELKFSSFMDPQGKGVEAVNSINRKSESANKELHDLLSLRCKLEQENAKELQTYYKKLNTDVGIHFIIFDTIKNSVGSLHTQSVSNNNELNILKEKVLPKTTKDLAALGFGVIKNDPNLGKLRDKMISARAHNEKKKTDETKTKYNTASEAFETSFKSFADHAEKEHIKSITTIKKYINEWIDLELNALKETEKSFILLQQELERCTAEECFRNVLTEANSKFTRAHSGRTMSMTRSLSQKMTRSTSQKMNQSKNSVNEEKPGLTPPDNENEVHTENEPQPDTGNMLIDMSNVVETASVNMATMAVLQPTTTGSLTPSISSSPGIISTVATSVANSAVTITPSTPTNDNAGDELDDEGYSVAPTDRYNDTKAAESDSSSDFTDSDDDEKNDKPAIMVKIGSAKQEETDDNDLNAFKLNITGPILSRNSQKANTRRTTSMRDRKCVSVYEDSKSIPDPVNRNSSLSTSAKPLQPITKVQTTPSSGSSTPPPFSPALNLPLNTKQTMEHSISSSSISSVKSIAGKISCKIAVVENVNVYFKESALGKVLISGKVVLSIPTKDIQNWKDNEENVVINLNNSEKITKVIPNPTLFENDITKMVLEEHKIAIPWQKLYNYLNKESKEVDIKATILEYQIQTTDLSFVPLRACSRWKCEPDKTILNFHFMYNNDATSVPLTSIAVLVPLSGGVVSYEDENNGKWNEEKQTLLWNIAKMDSKDQPGKCRAIFKVKEQSKPSKVMVKFSANGSTLSRFSVANDESSVLNFTKIINCFTADKYISDF